MVCVAVLVGEHPVTECRACHAAIIWLQTPTGAWAPVNAEPDPAGNMAINEHGRVFVIDLYTADAEPRYMPHFATCPHAHVFRRKHRGKK